MSATPLRSEHIPDAYGTKPLKKILAAAESQQLSDEAVGMSDLATSMNKAVEVTKKEMAARQAMTKKQVVATDMLSFPFEELMEIGDEMSKEFLKQNAAINGQNKQDPWATTSNLNFVFAKTLASWGKATRPQDKPLQEPSTEKLTALDQAKGISNEA